MLRRYLLFSVCIFSLFSVSNAQIEITGTVTDAGSLAPVQGAMVSLVNSGLSTKTDQNGNYSFISGVPVRFPLINSVQVCRPYLSAGRLFFGVTDKSARVRIDLYTAAGRHIAGVMDKVLTKGSYSTDPFLKGVSSQVFLLRTRIGENVAVLKMPFFTGRGRFFNGSQNKSGMENRLEVLAKESQAVDTVIAGAVGYVTATQTVTNLSGTNNFALQRKSSAGDVGVIRSSRSGDKLSVLDDISFIPEDGSSLPTVTVDTSIEYQVIIGYGAAFTETAVYCMSEIGEGPRKEIMNLLFNPYTGAGFTMGRTQIGCSDFSVDEYSLNDTPDDWEQANFSIDHELQWMIPMILEAKAVPGADIKIFAAPWSPPPWMKTNNGRLHGRLRTECYGVFALYLSRYVQAMNANGIEIWGLSMQNEPQFDSPWYPSCSYSAQEERDLLKDHLGPQLEMDGLLDDVKITIWDHNKDLLVQWGDVIIGDPDAAQFVWGAAYHWYAGDRFDQLDEFHDRYPEYFMFESEVAEPFKDREGIWDQDWGQAEREAHDLIGDMNHWSNGWNEWNLCVDENGGPGYTGSVGWAPIMTNQQNKTYYMNPHYYAMAHFSKYVRPDAHRIHFISTSQDLEVTAFKNTNGSVVVVAMNRRDNNVEFKIKQGTDIIKPTIPAHSIMTFVYF